MFSWFKKKPIPHPTKLHFPTLQFLGEQDGAVEQELKSRLVDFFQRDKSVITAYLARVAYDDPSSFSVALCMRTRFGEDKGLAEKVGKFFAVKFNQSQQMDIIFLNEKQELDLMKVCESFFKAGPDTSELPESTG
jgi:hypothetical protein